MSDPVVRKNRFQLVRNERNLTNLILFIGPTLRVWQWICNRSLWLDEAMLARHMVDRSPLELLAPLDFNQGGAGGVPDSCRCGDHCFWYRRTRTTFYTTFVISSFTCLFFASGKKTSPAAIHTARGNSVRALAPHDLLCARGEAVLCGRALRSRNSLLVLGLER